MKQPKTVVIHQPDFLPYLGFFHRLLNSDTFVILDHVQLLKRGWHHRDLIKGPNKPIWLSVPIVNIKKIQTIKEAKIDYSQNWINKHLNRIQAYYQKACYFEKVFFEIQAIYKQRPELLVDLNIALLNYVMDYFSIRVQVCRSSEWDIQTYRNEMNIELVKKVGGSIYLSGVGAKEYLDLEMFQQSGIDVVWQNYHCRQYPQLHGDFVENLSCLDFIMNCGDQIREYINVRDAENNHRASGPDGLEAVSG